MNRKQRRKMEKEMGLLKFKNSLPITERLRYQQEKIINAKRINEEQKESKEKQEEDEKLSQNVYSMALDISNKEKIPFVDALQKAQKEISSK